MAVLRAKNFSLARKSLEKWLQDYDAGKSAFCVVQEGGQAARLVVLFEINDDSRTMMKHVYDEAS